MSRGLKALGAVALVALLVALGLRALGGGDAAAPAGGPGPARPERTVPPTPDGVPGEGLYVHSDVTADGEVVVETWVRSRTPVSELRVTTTDPDLLPGSVESLDLVVRTLDGRMLAHRDSVGTNPQRIRLRTPATELFLGYTVDGGMDTAEGTVAGRRLARVLAMDVDYDGAAGVVRRVVTAAGTVLNVACLRPSDDFDATPRPCGRSTGEGGWTVDLRGPDRQDRLLAQLEG